MNKKGIFFTTLVILILTLFITSFTLYSDVQERKSVQKRIETMNNFLNSLEEDIPRQIFITGFRTIFRMEKVIIESGTYISDFDHTFEENFINGTIYGVEDEDLMLGATFPELLIKAQEKGRKINVKINMIDPKLSVTQEDPWRVRIALTVNLTLEDVSHLALWNKTETYVEYVPIEGFEDPLYVVNTNGIFFNLFNQSTSMDDFTKTTGDNSVYEANIDAPSFLDKLQGINTPNEQGIESLVNLERLSKSGMNALDKTIVDHIYFSDSNPPTCQVENKPTWFKVDSAHIDDYDGLDCI